MNSKTILGALAGALIFCSLVGAAVYALASCQSDPYWMCHRADADRRVEWGCPANVR